MKKIVIILSTVIFTINAFCQVNNTFSYDEIMKSEEWKSCLNTLERMEMLQIPSDFANSISTEQIVDLCLEYPYILETWFSKDYQEAFNKLVSSNNAFQELFNRDDAIEKLLIADNNIISLQDSFPQLINREKGRLFLKTFTLNMLLNHEKILNKLNDSQERSLISSFNKKAEMSLQPDGLFSGRNRIPIIVFLNKKSPSEAILSESGLLQMRSNLEYIPDTIYTPFMSLVPDAKKFIGEDYFTSGNDWIMAQETLGDLYHLELVGPPSLRYNGHGYAWANSYETWIEDSGASIYWLDGSFVEVSQDEATVVYYVDGHHSAKKINSTQYRSKLDDGWLVNHSLTLLPEEFCPTGTKKFYKQATLSCSIVGPSITCGSSAYYVDGIPTGSTVTWNFIVNSYLDSYLSQNSPSANYCTLSIPSQMSVNDTLVATISKNGRTITTVKKNVCANQSFSGYYSQTPNANIAHKYHYPTIPETPFDFSNFDNLAINPECHVTLRCPRFRNMSVSGSGTCSVTIHRIDQETIQIRTSRPSQPISFIILSFTGNQSCNDFNIIIDVYRNNVLASLSNQYTLDCVLVNNTIQLSIGDVCQNSGDSSDYGDNDEESPWQIRIVNISTGRTYYLGSCDSESSISTIGWPKGTYALYASKGNIGVSRKIAIH